MNRLISIPFFFCVLQCAVAFELNTVHNPNCGGFGNCDDSAFVAAAGPFDESLDFDVDAMGNPIPSINQDLPGTLFSERVTFSSKASATYGGVDSPFVNYGPNGLQIGPASGFDGILRIEFAIPVSSVGFGTVSRDLDFITVFSNDGIQTLDAPGSDDFDFNYAGFVACDHEWIESIELAGTNFGMQNIQFSVAVPEPSSILAFTALLFLTVGHPRRVVSAIHA